MSDRPSFFAELKRRNVYKVAVAYAVVGVAVDSSGNRDFSGPRNAQLGHASSWLRSFSSVSRSR